VGALLDRLVRVIGLPLDPRRAVAEIARRRHQRLVDVGIRRRRRWRLGGRGCRRRRRHEHEPDQPFHSRTLLSAACSWRPCTDSAYIRSRGPVESALRPPALVELVARFRVWLAAVLRQPSKPSSELIEEWPEGGTMNRWLVLLAVVAAASAGCSENPTTMEPSTSNVVSRSPAGAGNPS